MCIAYTIPSMSCFTLIILLMLFLTRICIVLVAAAAAGYVFLLDVRFGLFHFILFIFFLCTMSCVGQNMCITGVYSFCNVMDGIYYNACLLWWISRILYLKISYSIFLFFDDMFVRMQAGESATKSS